ncbi:hypothetical protein P8452_09469 [Trifolium repens]|nr:hypothetical protein P8452_09469 [Trifolium repens]
MAFFTSFSLSMFHLHASLHFHLSFSCSSSNFQICTADIEEGDGGEDGDGQDRLCELEKDTRETSVRDSDAGERCRRERGGRRKE